MVGLEGADLLLLERTVRDYMLTRSLMVKSTESRSEKNRRSAANRAQRGKPCTFTPQMWRRVERFFVRDPEGWFLAVVRAVVRVVIRGFDDSLCHGCFNGSATRGRKPATNTGGVARFT